jgi:hypothetical protein
MMSLRRKFTVPIAIVVAAATLPLLTGCFGNPIQGIVKAATGGKVNVGGGGNTLPSDFPTGVKVYSGTIVEAVSLGSGKKEVWNVTVKVPSASTINDIKASLVSEGFKIVSSGTSTDGAELVGASKTYSVIVGIAKDGSGWDANYTVGPPSS